MSDHAPISPSTYEYRELCPCWEPSRDAPGEMAERGTAIHKAIETESLTGLEQESDIECAKLGIKYIRYLKKGVGHTEFTEFRELRVDIFNQWGWVDELLCIPVSREAHLVDFKSGFHGVTDASENAQMQGYAQGVFSLFHWIEKLHVHIPLPRRQEISTHTYTRSGDMERISNRVFSIIQGAEHKDHYNPGWRQCEYCGNKGHCAALLAMTVALAPRVSPDLVIPESMDPAALDDGYKINLAVKLAKVLEPWADAVKQRARDWCAEGYQLDDFKMCPVSGSRSITDASVAYLIAQKYGVTLEEFLSCTSVTLGELENFVAAKAPKGVKGKRKDEFADELADANALTIGAPKFQLRSKTKELT
jgi:hypothetical protein